MVLPQIKSKNFLTIMLLISAVCTVFALSSGHRTVEASTGFQACQEAYGRDNNNNPDLVLVAFTDYEPSEGIGQFGDKVVCGDSVQSDSIIGLAQWDTGGNLALSRVMLYNGDYEFDGQDRTYFFEYQASGGDIWRASVQRSGNEIIGSGTGIDTGSVHDPANLLPLADTAIDSGSTDRQIDRANIDGQNTTTCEDNGGGFAWAFCGVLRVFSAGLDLIDKSLEGWLRMDRSRYDTDELRDAWIVIRNIAYILLVPAMLLMVIGTALGFEFVSAYTVKKALPRMVAATIFIALSYDLSIFFIDFVQTIGDGIHNIIIFPFNEVLGYTELTRDTKLIDIIIRPGADSAGGAVADNALSLGILALVGAVGASVWGGGLVATVAGFIGLAVLALLAVFVLLLARQTLIIAMVLVAPIALLSWIFPGRTRLFSIWNKTFWLMMWFYPIIMVTTAVGKVMAVLVMGGSGL